MCPVCFFVENQSSSKLCEICTAPNPGIDSFSAFTERFKYVVSDSIFAGGASEFTHRVRKKAFVVDHAGVHVRQ